MPTVNLFRQMSTLLASEMFPQVNPLPSNLQDIWTPIKEPIVNLNWGFFAHPEAFLGGIRTHNLLLTNADVLTNTEYTVLTNLRWEGQEIPNLNLLSPTKYHQPKTTVIPHF